MTGSGVGSPLEGITVLDFSHVLAGPYCAMLLGQLGADVVKIESPAGDQIRQWSGPNDVPVAFHNLNRGKRSAVLDLQTDQGRSHARALAARADVIVENFRPGTMAKFGLGYESLSEQNARLIYASISGFGLDGPYRDRGGYDLIVQGMAGIMSVTGHPGGEPTKAGVPVVDMGAALYTLAGILAALVEVRRTGRGRRIDMALLDVALSLTLWESAQYWMTGSDPEPVGSAHRFAAPYQAFRVQDGYITVAANTDRQFQRLVEVLQVPHLVRDSRFVTNSMRVAHKHELIALLQPSFESWTQAALLAQLEHAGVPCGPIYRMSEVYADPHVVARGLVQTVEDAAGHPVPVIRTPFRFAEPGTDNRIGAPTLGQHSSEVLQMLTNESSHLDPVASSDQ